MIRKHREEDLEEILDIWNKASTLTHPFVEDAYVEKVKKDMREIYIPGSETWVYEEEGRVIGFNGMVGNEFGGLFIYPNHQSKGVGQELVKFIRAFHDELEVEVFKLNKTDYSSTTENYKSTIKKVGISCKQIIHLMA